MKKMSFSPTQTETLFNPQIWLFIVLFIQLKQWPPCWLDRRINVYVGDCMLFGSNIKCKML